jgi:hypothetical protein
MRTRTEMSFLTLFTADTAVAHGQEFSPSSLVSRYWKETSPDPMNTLSSYPSAVSTVPEEAIITPTPLSPPPPPPQKKPSRKTKTSFYLAQPPPGSHARHRHCSRAERSLILQLQKVSNGSRALPTLDVLPSFVLGSKLKRVGQRLHGAGQQDIVFVTSEQYGAPKDQEEDSSEDEDDLNSRRVVASISQGYRRAAGEEGKGIRTTMIRFEDGLVWEASPLASGGYEFVAHEPSGVMRVAKWLPRPPNARRRSHQNVQQRTNPEPEERRYQFSILDNVTRRRPILAWMGQQSIDVLDRHPGNTVNSPCNSPANTPPASILEVDMSCEDGSQYSEVSEQLREIIVVTGTWVAIREGFASGGVRPSVDEGSLPTSPVASTFRSRATSGTYGIDVDNLVSDEPPNKRLHRQGSLLAHQTTTTSSRGSEPTVLPQRAKSTGSLVPNRLSRALGRSATPNIPEPVLEQPQASVRLVAPVGSHPVRPVSVPPPRVQPISPGVSKSFPGRNRHSTPAPLTRSPTDYLQPQTHGGNNRAATRSPSPLDLGKGRDKKGRFGLRAMMSSIFKRTAH